MLTVDSLRFAINRIEVQLEADHERLSALDAKLGDGDLGVTLLKAFRALGSIRDTLPDDLGAALLACSSAISKASSSSFGTLMATGLVAVAKDCRGTSSLAWVELARLTGLAREAMMSRGKASLGDKTVIDSLSAIERALAGLDDPGTALLAARQAAANALAEYRSRPNKIGRARIYAERSIGLDDPGMAAIASMLEGL